VQFDADDGTDGIPDEYFTNFSIMPDTISGELLVNGNRIEPTVTDASGIIYWDSLPAGTTSITFTYNRQFITAEVYIDAISFCYDNDSDGTPNYLDIDSDNDGIFDLAESGQNSSIVDTNNNGILDDMESSSPNDADGDGLSDALESTFGENQGITPLNTDSDIYADFLDTDSDNDGCFDAIEGAGHFDASDLDFSGALNSEIDTNGIPTIANGGTNTSIAVTDSNNVTACNAFDCESAFYQIIENNLQKLDILTSTFQLIGTSTTRYNGIAWDIRSHLIYGNTGSGHLVVVVKQGVFDLGTPNISWDREVPYGV